MDLTKTKKLKCGTYGNLHVAVNQGGKEFAVKVSQEDSLEVTLKELRILSFINHPNVVKLIDFKPGEKFRLILELAECDLAGKTFTGEVLKKITYQLIRGLAYLHDKDVIHADIKPQNLLYTHCDSEIRVMFADFGISEFGLCPRMLLPKGEAFTLWYRPSEKLLGGEFGFPADIWALGCTLVELYTGMPLFPGDSEMDQLFKIFRVLGTPDETIWPNVSKYPYWKANFPIWKKDDTFWDIFNTEPEFKSLLQKMLILNPGQRSTALQLLTDPYFDSVRDTIDNKISCLASNDRFGSSCDQILAKRKVTLPTDVNIENNYRIIVFEWGYDLKKGYKLTFESLFLALDLFDEIEKDKLRAKYQLNFCSCLKIASDIIETYPVHLDEFVYISSNSFTGPELMSTIYKNLEVIGKKLYRSTCFDFLQTYSRAVSAQVRLLAIFYLLIIRMNKDLNKYSPESMALAALKLSLINFPNETFRFDDLHLNEVEAVTSGIKNFLIKYEKNIKSEGDLSKMISGIPFENLSL